MRTQLRTIVSLATLTLASCAAPNLAFAQDEGPHPDVVDAVSALSADAPFAPRSTGRSDAAPAPAPSAPAEAPEIPGAVAIVEEDEAEDDAPPADPRLAAADAWFAKHFHGLGPHLTEYVHGRLLAALEDLKVLLLELPLS